MVSTQRIYGRKWRGVVDREGGEGEGGGTCKADAEEDVELDIDVDFTVDESGLFGEDEITVALLEVDVLDGGVTRMAVFGVDDNDAEEEEGGRDCEPNEPEFRLAAMEADNRENG